MHNIDVGRLVSRSKSETDWSIILEEYDATPRNFQTEITDRRIPVNNRMVTKMMQEKPNLGYLM